MGSNLTIGKEDLVITGDWRWKNMQTCSHKFEMKTIGFPAKIPAPPSSISFEETRPRIDHVSIMLSL